jgi:hypothetical protein
LKARAQAIDMEEACAKLRNLTSKYGNDSLQEFTAKGRTRLNCPGVTVP